MQIQALTVGQLQTNCYLVSDEGTREGIIIDPGDDAELIIQKLLDEKIKPEAIIATHGHFDHVLAALEVKLAFGIPFCLHKNDLPILKRMQVSARHFLGVKVGPPTSVDIFLKEKDKITFGRESFGILETPGHTPGGISLYSRPNKMVLVGDTLFSQGEVGRTDFSYASVSDLKTSIKKILKLPPETVIYTGHGEATTIGEWKSYSL